MNETLGFIKLILLALILSMILNCIWWWDSSLRSSGKCGVQINYPNSQVHSDPIDGSNRTSVLGMSLSWISGSKWTWERWQWSVTPHFPKLQHYWNPTIKLFSVIWRSLFVGSLTPLQKSSWCILQPQPIGLRFSVISRTDVEGVLLHCREAVSRLGKNSGGARSCVYGEFCSCTIQCFTSKYLVQ